MLPPFSSRRASALLSDLPTALGGVLFLLSNWTRVQALNLPFDYYDDGILLNAANQTLVFGAMPYRDFYSNYPPGVPWLIAGLWWVFGVSALPVRLLTIALHLALAGLSGRICGRLAGRRFSWFASGLVSLWTLVLALTPYAWLLGLVFALLFVERTLAWADRPSTWRLTAAGCALGLVGCSRHDLFLYFFLAVLGLWALPSRAFTWLGAREPPRGFRSRWLVLGAAVPLLSVWGPCFVSAGVQPIHDLFLTQILYVQPARVLPFPSLFTRVESPALPLALPALMTQTFEAAVAMTLAGPALALACFALRRSLGWLKEELTLLLVGCLAVSVLPQMLLRTDRIHASFAVVPAVLLTAALVEASALRAARPLLAAGLVVGAVGLLTLPHLWMIWPLDLRRPGYEGLTSYALNPPRPGFHDPDWLVPARQAVFDYVAAHTSAGEAVYFGTTRHDRVHANEPDLYFLSNRRGGTRYTQFDPNLVTREDVQREMIAWIERQSVRVVVLSSRVNWLEGQAGTLAGSSLLDEYIHAHYRAVGSFPPYTVYARVDG